MSVKKSVKIAARILFAATLLGLVVWLAHPSHLGQALVQAQASVVLFALVVAILSNVASAVRWAYIARVLGLFAPIPRLIASYARGIVLNALLPGATLSGDVLRSLELSRAGNPLGLSSLSVVLDRVSGFWVLCAMSGLFALTAVILHLADAYPLALAHAPLFAGALLLAIVSPALLFLPLPTRLGDWVAEGARFIRAVMSSRTQLARQLGWSAAVQLLSAGALWLCTLAIGLSLPFWLVAVAAAPIFTMAAVPLGFGGWGTRELAAIVVLGAFGVSAEKAAASAILYGLCAVAQAALATPLLVYRRREEAKP